MWSLFRPVLGMMTRHRGQKLFDDFRAKTAMARKDVDFMEQFATVREPANIAGGLRRELECNCTQAVATE